MKKPAFVIAVVACAIALLAGCSSAPAGPTVSFKIESGDKPLCTGTVILPKPSDWVETTANPLKSSVVAECTSKAAFLKTSPASRWSSQGVYGVWKAEPGVTVQKATIDGKNGIFVSNSVEEAHGAHQYSFYQTTDAYSIVVEWTVPTNLAKKPGVRAEYAAIFKQMTINVTTQ